MLFNRIMVIGAGLIGGSYIRAILKLDPNQDITVVEPDSQTRDMLVSDGLKNVYASIYDVRDRFDLIMLTTREEVTATYLATMPTELIDDRSIVTDFCSTKQRLAKVAKKAMIDSCYIGAHPIFGDVSTGYENSHKTEIAGTTMVLMNSGKNHAGFEKLKSFIEALGQTVVCMDEHDHDVYYASVSHLTHLMAFLQDAMLTNRNELLMPPSYKRQSHLAAADRMLWSEVFAFNQDSLVHLVDNMISQLSQFKQVASNAKASAINDWLENLNEREQLSILRQQIDTIDKHVAELLKSRLTAAKQIGGIKQNHKLEIVQGAREQEVYNRVQSTVETSQFDKHILGIYSTIIEKSRLVQES